METGDYGLFCAFWMIGSVENVLSCVGGAPVYRCRVIFVFFSLYPISFAYLFNLLNTVNTLIKNCTGKAKLLLIVFDRARA